jgi:hypothetical protein
LASIYAVYAGGVTAALLLCLPVITLGFALNWKVGVLGLILAGCFMLGLCLNLLGRLCGFYALGDFTQPIESEPTPALLPDPGVMPSTDGAGRHPAVPIPTASPAEREPVPVSSEVTAQAPAPGTGAVSVSPARTSNTPAVAAVPIATPRGAAPIDAVPARPAANAVAATTPALPALLDASERIDPILQRFEQDPAGALRALEDLRQSFAPHPQVLVALCICRHRNGEIDEAVSLATTVVPICFERGHVQLAAQVFKQLRREVDRLGLNREQTLIVGDALLKKGDLPGAGAAYSSAIGRDPGETRAVKGLIQVAAVYVDQRNKPEAALKVYDYLLKHCGDSSHAEFVRESRDRCRKLVAPPVG